MDHGGLGGGGGGLEAASMASARAGRVDLPTFPGETEFKILSIHTKNLSHLDSGDSVHTTFSLSLLNLRGKHFPCRSLS